MDEEVHKCGFDELKPCTPSYRYFNTCTRNTNPYRVKYSKQGEPRYVYVRPGNRGKL